jgi:hypothetical protein
MGAKLTLKGVPEFERKVKVLATLFPKSARRGIYLGLELVMTDSKRNYVPVKDGILRSSGFVTLSEDETKLQGTIGFGGPAGSGNQGGETNSADVGYAIVQHENLDFAHRIGEAKYLERPLFQGIPMIGETIVSVIQKDTGIS